MSFKEIGDSDRGVQCTALFRIGGNLVEGRLEKNDVIPSHLPVIVQRVLSRMAFRLNYLTSDDSWFTYHSIEMRAHGARAYTLSFMHVKALTGEVLMEIENENSELMANKRPAFWNTVTFEAQGAQLMPTTNIPNKVRNILSVTATFFGENLDDEVFTNDNVAKTSEAFNNRSKNPTLVRAPNSSNDHQISSILKNHRYQPNVTEAVVKVTQILRKRWPLLDHRVNISKEDEVHLTFHASNMASFSSSSLEQLLHVFKQLPRELVLLISTQSCLETTPSKGLDPGTLCVRLEILKPEAYLKFSGFEEPVAKLRGDPLPYDPMPYHDHGSIAAAQANGSSSSSANAAPSSKRLESSSARRPREAQKGVSKKNDVVFLKHDISPYARSSVKRASPYSWGGV